MQMRVMVNNETGDKTITYWPVGSTGTTVYRNGEWTSSSYKTITISKSTLTNQNNVDKAYNWLIANATKLS